MTAGLVVAGSLGLVYVAYRIGYGRGVDATAAHYREHLRALDYAEPDDG